MIYVGNYCDITYVISDFRHHPSSQSKIWLFRAVRREQQYYHATVLAGTAQCDSRRIALCIAKGIGAQATRFPGSNSKIFQRFWRDFRGYFLKVIFGPPEIAA